MSLRGLIALLLPLALAACGVTAGNPGSGGKTHDRFSLYGSVQTLERTSYAPMRVGVYDGHGHEVTYATSASNSTYFVDGLEPGAYWIQIGEGYREPLRLEEDTLLNVILPLPAAPSHLRFVSLGPNDFCLLWSDNSGVESGYQIIGPHETWQGPANAVGVRLFLGSVLEPNRSESLSAAVAEWNAEFSGRYALSAWNAYGASATAAIGVAPYGTAQWTLLAPPAEPPQSDGNPEKEACLSAERRAGQPLFIVP